MYTPAYIEKKINSEMIGFHFGMGAFHIFCETRKINLDKIQDEFEKDNMGAMSDLLYSAAKFNLLLKGKDVPFNKYTAMTWLDVLTEKDINEIMEVFSKSQIMGKKLIEEEKGAKKKVIK